MSEEQNRSEADQIIEAAQELGTEVDTCDSLSNNKKVVIRGHLNEVMKCARKSRDHDRKAKEERERALGIIRKARVKLERVGEKT